MFHDINLNARVCDPCCTQLYAIANQHRGTVFCTSGAIRENGNVVTRAAAAGGAPEERDQLLVPITVQVADYRQVINDACRRPRRAAGNIRFALPTAVTQRYRIIEQPDDRCVTYILQGRLGYRLWSARRAGTGRKTRSQNSNVPTQLIRPLAAYE